MNDQLEQSLARLLAADAQYKAFVETTRSHQLACEGAREALAAMEKRDSALIVARAELAFNHSINMDYEIIPDRDERCWDLYVGEDWYKSFGSRDEAEIAREELEAEDERAA